MATADELLGIDDPINTVLTIDENLRTITIPDGVKNLGVESDDDVHRLQFQMPRHIGDIDLSEFTIRVNYLNANGDGDCYDVEDAEVETDSIKFSWLVGRFAFTKMGNVTFNVCLKKMDEEAVVIKEFNTTVATLPVLKGLETSEQIIQQNADALVIWRNSLLKIVDDHKDEVDTAIETHENTVAAEIQEHEEMISSAITTQNNTIDTVKDELLNKNYPYEAAIRNGFEGTEAEWLEGLKGLKGAKGDTGIYVGGTEPTEYPYFWFDTSSEGSGSIFIDTPHGVLVDESLTVEAVYEELKGEIDELEIGGRNLFADSSMELGEGWLDYPYVVDSEGIDGGKCFKVQGRLRWYTCIPQSNEHVQHLLAEGYFKPGEKYTISYWAKAENLVYGTTDPQIGLGMAFVSGSSILENIKYTNKVPEGTSDWTLYKEVITIPTTETSGASITPYFGFSDFTGIVYIDKIKLEKGNKATDWTPATEDVIADIAESSKTATNFMEFDESDGLLVGNKKNGTWSGYRAQITSSMFNIINAAGAILASYGERLIEIGKELTDAVIRLCGDTIDINSTHDINLSSNSGSVRINTGGDDHPVYINDRSLNFKYSDSEQWTGEYNYDGKKIYIIGYTFTTSQSDVTTWTSTGLKLSNIYRILDIRGYSDDDSQFNYYPRYEGPNLYLNFAYTKIDETICYQVAAFSNKKITINVKYTKTSD